MSSSRFIRKNKVNIYEPNFGNKLQGLAQSPDVLSKIAIKRRADGSDRHNIGKQSNQVGGIGTKIPQKHKCSCASYDINPYEQILVLNDTNFYQALAYYFDINIEPTTIPKSEWYLIGNFGYANENNIKRWDVSAVTIMDNAFYSNEYDTKYNASNFNIDISNWDVSSVTTMQYMFYDCSNLTSLDVSNWDTSSVTYMNSLFQGCSNLISLNVSNWNTSSVSNMLYLFQDCSKLTSLNVSNWNTSSVTNMSSMFYNCKSLTNIMFGNGWDASSVTDMSYMFTNCKLNSLDVSNWDIGNNLNENDTITMESMFSGCSNLTSLNVSNLNTSSVTNMSRMFQDCSNLISLDVSNWDTSSVTYMKSLFQGCSKLTSLNVSNWNTSSVTNMSSMFYNCSSLESINVSSWNVSNVKYMNNMFYNCSSLESINVSSWNTENVSNFESMFNRYTSFNTDLSKWNVSGVIGTDDTSLINVTNMFLGTALLDSVDTDLIDSNTGTPKYAYFNQDTNDVLTFDEDENIANADFLLAIQYYFNGAYDETDNPNGVILSNTLSEQESLIGQFDPDSSGLISNWDVSAVTNMSGAFYQPDSYNNTILTDVQKFNEDLSGWKVSKVTDFSYMFYGCSAFDQDLGKWTINSNSNSNSNSNVDMKYMFYGCSAFTGYGLDSWNTSNVTDMSYMFYGCSAFDQDLGKWERNDSDDVSTLASVTNMQGMFSECSSFTGKGLDSWKVSNVYNFSGMFYNCLMFFGTDIIYNWTINSNSNVDMSYMFQGCINFNEDLSNWNVSNVTDMKYMFYECIRFNADISNWDVSNVTDMNNMFYECINFNADISNWNVSNVTDMNNMFYKCINFNADISNWDVSNVTDMKYMFYECIRFNQDVSNWDVIGVTIGESLKNVTEMFSGTGTALISNVNDDSLISSDGTPTYAYFNQDTNDNVLTFDEDEETANADFLLAIQYYFNGAYDETDNPNGVILSNTLSEQESLIGQFDTNSSESSGLISNWDVSAVTNMSNAFYQPDSYNNTILTDVQKFNEDLSGWKVSKVTDFSYMFYGCSTFNQDLSNWTINSNSNSNSNVDMKYMFYECTLFNQDISNWVVSSVIDMSYMFHNCKFFNANISNWDVSNVKDMSYMFSLCTFFNKDISNWNVSNVEDMSYMFYECTLFNQDISNWVVSSVIDMSYMFHNCKFFNQDLSKWERIDSTLENVNNMKYMFSLCKKYNYNVKNWNINGVTNTDKTDFNDDPNTNFNVVDHMFFITLVAGNNTKTIIDGTPKIDYFNDSEPPPTFNTTYGGQWNQVISDNIDVALSVCGNSNTYDNYFIEYISVDSNNQGNDDNQGNDISISYENDKSYPSTITMEFPSYQENDNNTNTLISINNGLYKVQNSDNNNNNYMFTKSSDISLSATGGQLSLMYTLTDIFDYTKAKGGYIYLMSEVVTQYKISEITPYSYDENSEYNNLKLKIEGGAVIVPPNADGNTYPDVSSSYYVSSVTNSNVNSPTIYDSNDPNNNINIYLSGDDGLIHIDNYNATDSENWYTENVTNVDNIVIYWVSNVYNDNGSSNLMNPANETDFSIISYTNAVPLFNKDDNNNSNIITLDIRADTTDESLDDVPIYYINSSTETNTNVDDLDLFIQAYFVYDSSLNVSNPKFVSPDTTSFNYTPEVDSVGNSLIKYYYPTKFPCGDYNSASEYNTKYELTNTVSGYIPPYSDGSVYPMVLLNYPRGEPIMTADQCRWLWRMGNYVGMLANDRTLYDGPDDDDNNIQNMTFSSLIAQYIAYQSSGYLSLNLPVYSFYLSPGGESSGDVMPPFLTALSTLYIYDSTLSSGDYDISTMVDAIYNNGDNNIPSISSELSAADMTSGLKFANYVAGNTSSDISSNTIWPLYDAYKAGGQQIGLAGCGMGCSLPFLSSTSYNIMYLYYGGVDTTFDWGTNINGIDNDTLAGIMCDAYKILYLRGNGGYPYSILTDTDTNTGSLVSVIQNDGNLKTFADALGPQAYLTNVRIRNVNISEADEMSLGYTNTTKSSDNTHMYQPLFSQNDTKSDGNNYVKSWIKGKTNEYSGTTYVQTDFPIHGIPDAGWGALTAEIFTYQGIVAVIRNDYEGFCAWHRMYYYLLFVQNGGYMTNWNDKIDPDNYEAIDPETAKFGFDTDENGNVTGYSNNGWLPPYCTGNTYAEGQFTYSTDDDKKGYTLYAGDHQWPRDGDVGSNQTTYWANRLHPYRGDDTDDKKGWTLPCYVMGYSPVWVAGGINNTTQTGSDGNSTDDTPLWEALNPYYSIVGGLYTAADADTNALMAYKLAALKWGQNEPDIDNYDNNYKASTGYNCDVANYNNVVEASVKYDDGETADGKTVFEKIGYGVDKGGSIVNHTTWEYMYTSISKCLISTKGLTGDNDYGSFVNYINDNKRIITLGRDTNSSAVKTDYIDLAAYTHAKNAAN